MITETLEVIDVLLVEDDPGDVFLTREAFADNKVRNRLHVVATGTDAMRFLHRDGEYSNAPVPDLILLDLNLPPHGRPRRPRRNQVRRGLTKNPVVILTSSDDEADVLRSYHLHANAYVRKPVDFDRFIHVVR